MIRSVNFLSLKVVLCLYKSKIRTYMEYCCHTWASSCYLDMLNKLAKQVCRTDGPTLAASVESLVHCRNAVSLYLFYRYHFGRCSSELAEMVLLPCSHGSSNHHSDRLCIIFMSAFQDLLMMSISTVSVLTYLDSRILYLQNAFL